MQILSFFVHTSQKRQKSDCQKLVFASLKTSEWKMHNVITDAVGRGGCQEGWREWGRERRRVQKKKRKKKISAQIKKVPQNEIKMSDPLSRTLNIKGKSVKYTWPVGELRRMLSSKLLPVTHNPAPAHHTAFRELSDRCHLSNGAVSCSPRQQETGRHKREETISYI